MNPQPEYIQMETAEAMHGEIVSLRAQLAESKVDREMLAEAQRKLGKARVFLDLARERIDTLCTAKHCAECENTYGPCIICELEEFLAASPIARRLKK